jgi:thioesterase domain-containing protein/aryl carrier-like protein
MTTDTSHLSDAKRALLEKRLQRDLPPARTRPRRITPRPPGSRVPLSFEQEQLWRDAQLAPGAPIDAEFITVSMTGPLDGDALERSLNEIIRRHDIVRTTFPVVDGQPMQVIQPAATVALPVVDLQQLPPAEREAEAIRRATEEARQGFDLARGPLLRATLMQLDDAAYKLFLVLHHIVFDCLSWYAVFLPELAALYQAFSAGKPSLLPDLPIQYADYAHWQRQWVQEQDLDGDLAYWRTQLGGSLPVLELPTDRPRPPLQTFRGAMQSVVLPGSLTQAVEALSRREGVTFFMTLVAAFQTLLYRYSGQDDILVGIDTGGRQHAEVEQLIGFFLHTLVLRTDLSGNPTFRELLRRVREVTLGAYSHDAVPFASVLKEVQPQRDPSRYPLFQVVIRLGPRLAPLECGWTATPADVDPGVSKFDLTLEVYETVEGAICRLEYNTDLFDHSTMTRLLTHFQTVLEGMLADPEQRIGDLPLTAACETRPMGYRSAGLLHARGHDGASETPALLSSPSRHKAQTLACQTACVAAPTSGDRAGQNDTFVAPTLLVQQQLIAIWEDLLDVRPIGIGDDFFNLGGTSLRAVRVVERIEQVWGKKIALATLFAGPTIEQLAQALLEARDDESSVRTPLVPLQTGGSRQPFFFLHGHYLGTASYCFPLARALGPDQPFYALDPYKLDDLAVPPTLEEIAATHLEALRAIQPAGPYLLGGFCNGGLVAYEIARQLHAAGQAVDLLVLMDPMPLPQDFQLLYRALRAVLAVVRLSPQQQVAWFVRLRHLVQHLYSYLRGHRGDAEDPALASLILTKEALHHDYLGLLHWSVLAYRPPSVYPGKVTFFWPADEPWHARWWRPVAQATVVEEHLLPGTQDTWKTDHLPALSACLRLCLDNAHTAVKAPVAGGQTND